MYFFNVYIFSFSPSYLFQLAAILRQLTTKWLKTHSNKSVPTMLCMCMYSSARINLLLWVLLSYLVVRTMRMATRRNIYQPHNVGGGGNIHIYIYSCISIICEFLGTKRLQSLTMHGQNDKKLYLCVMCMHEYYLCSNELLICRPFRSCTYTMRKYWETGITHTPPLNSFHKMINSNYQWDLEL
jgi:hypothetical protein